MTVIVYFFEICHDDLNFERATLLLGYRDPQDRALQKITDKFSLQVLATAEL